MDMAWITVQSETELKNKLVKMAKDDQRSVSGMVRWLIEEEWGRRNESADVDLSQSVQQIN